MELMENMQGAIFDLDGTLLDSMGVWEQIDQDFLSRRGLMVPDDYIAAVTPLGFQDAAEYTIKRFYLTDTPDELIREWSEMAEYAYGHTVPLKPYAGEYLRKLKKQGVKLAVATALTQALYIPALKNNGIYELFHSFTTLGETGGRKGEPGIYLKAAQKIDVPPKNCAVFEDILEGIRGASAGGFYTVGVFDTYSAHDKERMQASAGRYIKDFSELIAL